MAIKASDLRVGNWIVWDGKPDRYCKVILVSENGRINTMPISLGLLLNDYSPIPITPDILIKCGFGIGYSDKENCNINFTNINNPEYWVQYHTDCNDFIFYGMSNSIEKPIQFVHQIQNLYYALTNTEIEYKP